MKAGILSLLWLFCIPIFLAACASRRVTTPTTSLNSNRADFPGAHIALENIRFFVSNVPRPMQTGMGYNAGAAISGAMNGTVVTPSIVVVQGDPNVATLMYSMSFERQLYDDLRNLSEDKISSASHSPYEIERIEAFVRFPDQKVGQLVAVRATSFFVPPLANVKTELECPFQIGYVLKKNEKLIRKHVVSGTIKGDYKGWYVAGATEGKRLIIDLNNTAEHEIAVRLLNEISVAIEEDREESVKK